MDSGAREASFILISGIPSLVLAGVRPPPMRSVHGSSNLPDLFTNYLLFTDTVFSVFSFSVHTGTLSNNALGSVTIPAPPVNHVNHPQRYVRSLKKTDTFGVAYVPQ